MLDSIAPELILHILSFLTSPGHTHLPHLRTRTFYSLCLVSRRLRDCAQPLLWQTVDFASWQQAEPISREAEVFGKYTRVLAVYCSVELSLVDLPLVLRSLPDLEDVRVTNRAAFPSQDDRSTELLPLLAALPSEHHLPLAPRSELTHPIW
jgi:hypothetical protein